MIKEAMQYFLEVSQTESQEVVGRPYSTKPLHRVETPQPKGLEIHTLTGVRDYIDENIDGLELDGLLIQVDAKSVIVRSRLQEPWQDRAAYVFAKWDQPEFSFGKYMDIETFIVELQAKFVQDNTIANILQLVGNITDDLVSVYADDGVTQAVNTKNSIGMKDNKPLPNPVILRPYRTFNEIEQPEGRFVFRMASGAKSQSGRPVLALFEADGGMWQQIARESIRAWLRANIKNEEQITIIA